MPVTQLDEAHSEMQETALQLEDVLVTLWSNFNNEETQKIEEVITEYEQVFFATKDSD
jgi:DNA-binding protein H-NS